MRVDLDRLGDKENATVVEIRDPNTIIANGIIVEVLRNVIVLLQPSVSSFLGMIEWWAGCDRGADLRQSLRTADTIPLHIIFHFAITASNPMLVLFGLWRGRRSLNQGISQCPRRQLLPRQAAAPQILAAEDSEPMTRTRIIVDQPGVPSGGRQLGRTL
jgi:hypothetical protein